MQPFQRLLIIGPPGAGKSTLGARLAEDAGVPIVHLDSLFWSEGWKERPDDEFRVDLEQALAGERWVIEGMFWKTLEERMGYADLLLYLDFSTALCMRRVLKRIISGYGRTRADMADGCPEQFDFEFLRYVFDFRKKIRPKVEEILARAADRVGCEVLRFTKPKQLAAWLEESSS